jgi:hypothetical protein
MRHLSLLLSFVISAWAQTTPVLNQSQIQQLEATVERNPADRQSQTLLGKNYPHMRPPNPRKSVWDRR